MAVAESLEGLSATELRLFEVFRVLAISQMHQIFRVNLYIYALKCSMKSLKG